MPEARISPKVIFIGRLGAGMPMIPRIGAAGKPLAVEVPCGAVHYKPRAEYRGRIDSPQPHSAAKGSLLCK